MAFHPFPWYDAFLAALREWPVVQHACDVVGIERSTAYRYRHANEEFAKAWDEAMEAGIDRAEKEALRRAVEGEAEPVIYQGQPTYVLVTDEAGYPVYDTVQEERYTLDDKGKRITELVDVKRPRRKLDANGQPIVMTVRKRSDSLLAFLLKGRRKSVYAERIEQTGADGGPVKSQVIVATGVPSKAPDGPATTFDDLA